jgi:DNA-binding GntR family transcriptional regulator
VPRAIAAELRDRIFAGRLRPDDPLTEAGLAAEFDASRNTVREGLLLLEHEGLIQRRAHRGSRVAHPDLDEVRDVMALRRAVEPGAVRVLTRAVADPSAPSPDLTPLRETAAAMEAAASAGDWDRYGVLDLRFHGNLVAAAGSRTLAEEFRRATLPLHLHLLASDLREKKASQRAHVFEHRALVEAIAAGGTRRALDLIDRHLAEAEAALFGAREAP